jgi:hypothetical protein
MANGSKAMNWTPANDAEEAKAERGEVYQGKDGKFYQHENMPKASAKNPPASVESAPKAPSAADLDAVAAEEAAKQATAAAPGAPSTKAVEADFDKVDSTGKNLKSGAIPGPKGKDAPPDVLSDAERSKIASAAEARISKNMANTHAVDSIGNKKGSFKVVPQGLDRNGAKIPDKVDYSKPVTPVAAQLGPRGSGAPKDTFHRS